MADWAAIRCKWHGAQVVIVLPEREFPCFTSLSGAIMDGSKSTRRKAGGFFLLRPACFGRRLDAYGFELQDSDQWLLLGLHEIRSLLFCLGQRLAEASAVFWYGVHHEELREPAL